MVTYMGRCGFSLFPLLGAAHLCFGHGGCRISFISTMSTLLYEQRALSGVTSKRGEPGKGHTALGID